MTTDQKTRFANAKRAQVLTATGSKAMPNVTLKVEVDSRGADVQFSLYDTTVTISLSVDQRRELAEALWSTLA